MTRDWPRERAYRRRRTAGERLVELAAVALLTVGAAGLAGWAGQALARWIGGQ